MPVDESCGSCPIVEGLTGELLDTGHPGCGAGGGRAEVTSWRSIECDNATRPSDFLHSDAEFSQIGMLATTLQITIALATFR